jgi:NTE family protein
MTRIQFAFQGGGAKLGALLGAAEAIYTQQGPLNFKVARVSGTSAGAIIACILATGENPAIFRQRLINLAAERLNTICKKHSYPGLGFHLFFGNPLYDSDAYRQFLTDLFDLGTKKWEYLDELDRSIDVFVHAVDVRTREPKIYRKGEGGTIVQALFDSSALPFIFKTFKDQTGIFDGGLVNNFPAEVLLEGRTTYGPVAGFSFRREPIKFTFSGLKDFAGALVSTMMDNATYQALSKIPTGDVHYIETSTRTLDFQTALENDLKGTNYAQYVRQANAFLADFLARYRMQRSSMSSSAIAKRMMELHDTLRERHKVLVKKVVLELKSNSLKVRNLSDPSSIDEFYLSTELISVTPVYTFGFRLTIEEEVFNPGDIKPLVLDEERNSIGVSTFPISPNLFGGEVPDNNIILFFHEPLIAGRKYTITFSGKAQEVLYDMITLRRYDSISYFVRNTDHVEEVDLIVYIPTDLPPPALKQGSWTLSQGMIWKSGVELSKPELADFWNAYPEFYPIGWRGRNLGRGDVIGIRAHNSEEN